MEESGTNPITEEEFDLFLGYEGGQSSSESQSSDLQSSLENTSSEENQSETSENDSEALTDSDEEQLEALDLFNSLFYNHLASERLLRTYNIARAERLKQQAKMATHNPTAIETLFLGGNAVRQTARNDDDLIATASTCAKTDRATLKTTDKKSYEKLKEACCSKLSNATFELIKPIDSKTAASQLKEVTSVVAKVNALKKRLRSDDTIDVFTIPKEMNLNTTTNHYEPSTTSSAIDLLADYRATDLDNVKRATAWYARYGQDYHTENVVWSGELILRSCSESLRLKIIESVAQFEEAEKGGPTYFYILMEKMIATSQTALRGLVIVLNNTTLKDFGGENVFDCASFFRAAAVLLRDNSMLPTDMMNIAFTTFGSSSCPEFNSLVSGLKTAVDLKLKEYSLEQVLQLLEGEYNDKIGSNKWPAKDTKANQESSFTAGTGVICFNCGGFHTLDQCPKPLDDDAIAKRKQIMFGNTKSGNGNNGSNKGSHGKKNGGSNNKGDKKKGNSGSTPAYKIPPKSGEAHEKELNGKKVQWCGKCGRWGNHPTANHKSKEQIKKEKEEKAGSAETGDNSQDAGLGYGTDRNIGGASCLNF